MRKNSVKNTRINGEVQKALAEIIRSEIKDPRIRPFTSVVKAEVSPDLKTAKVWISVLGDEAAGRETCKGLASAEGFIRGRLAKMVNLRNTPELRFILDASIAYGVDMSKKIDEVIGQDERKHKETPQAAGETDAERSGTAVLERAERTDAASADCPEEN